MLRPPPKTDDPARSLVDQLVGYVGRPRLAVTIARAQSPSRATQRAVGGTALLEVKPRAASA